MLLSETIQNSKKAINQRRRALENKQDMESYMKALATLDAVAKNIHETLVCASAIKEKGIINESFIDNDMRTELLNSIDDCGNGIEQYQLSLETVKLLKSKGDTLSSQLKAVWKSAAASYSDGTKGYLTMIGGLSSDPKRAKELTANIEKTTSRNPSVTAVDKLVADVREAQKITESFELNANIEGFLRKVSSQKATVADLTPTVTQWLKDKRLMSKLKITF